MLKRVTQTILLATTTVLAMLGLAACGGSSSGKNLAINAAGYTISKATVSHWIPIEVMLAHEVFPTGPPPKGLVPDPPNYTECIAYLRHGAPGGTASERSKLKKECREHYEGVRTHIIDYLITYHWLDKEAAKQGLNVTYAQARKDMQEHIKTQFKNRTAFNNYLKYTGLTIADEILRFRNNLLSTAVLNHVLLTKGQSDKQHAQAFKSFFKRWIAQTHCQPGYVVPNCSEYKGSEEPGA